MCVSLEFLRSLYSCFHFTNFCEGVRCKILPPTYFFDLELLLDVKLGMIMVL